MEGVVMIKRACGHSSPYTFKKVERYAKQRLENFLAKKCPECTRAAIAALEEKQRLESLRLKEERRAAKALARQVESAPATPLPQSEPCQPAAQIPNP